MQYETYHKNRLKDCLGYYVPQGYAARDSLNGYSSNFTLEGRLDQLCNVKPSRKSLVTLRALP